MTSCEFCAIPTDLFPGDGAYTDIGHKGNDYFTIDMDFSPTEKTVGALVSFGCETVIEIDVPIKYCPMCGREL